MDDKKDDKEANIIAMSMAVGLLSCIAYDQGLIDKDKKDEILEQHNKLTKC